MTRDRGYAGWVGFADPQSVWFDRGGLSEGPRAIAVEPLLSRGTLRLEIGRAGPALGREIVEVVAARPWPVGLSLRLTRGGDLIWSVRQPGYEAEATLPLGLAPEETGITISYLWDGPARTGWLVADRADPLESRVLRIEAPRPLTTGWVEAACRSRLSPHVTYLAVADAPAPVGAQAGLPGQARIDTPEGPVSLGDLKPGMIVRCADGRAAQVRARVMGLAPARGRNRPVTIRAGHMGAERDVTLSSDTRLGFAGPAVEQLFGRDDVLCPAGHLVGSASVTAAKAPPFAVGHLLLLDRPDLVRIDGVTVQTYDPAPLRANPAAHRLSCLSKLPAELLPRRAARDHRVIDTRDAFALATLWAA